MPDADGPAPTTPRIERGQGTVDDLDRFAPHGFELAILAAASALGSVGTVGLLLAILGRYATLTALIIGLPIAAAAVVALHRHLPRGAASRAAHLGAAAALVLAVAYGAFAGLTPSQNVVVSRDPGSYVTTARWLAREGDLTVDARDGAFEGVIGLQFAGAAVYDVGDPEPPLDVELPPGELRQSGELEFQFNHLASVALAAAYDVGGHELMFRLPAAMSALTLLLLYAVTVRVTRRPLVSLLAPMLLAASTPLLYVSRNTYSESFASVLLWAGILVLLGLHRRPRVAAGAIGGALLGALTCTRVDALVYVAMVLPLSAISVAAATDAVTRSRRLRAWGATIGAAALLGLVGWIDLTRLSGQYARDLDDQLSLLRAALLGSAAASALGLLVWWKVEPLRRAAGRLRRPVGAIAAVSVVALLLAGWLIRPYVQTASTDLVFPTVEAIQRQEGLPIEPNRSYAEQTLRWMAWYLGAPALAAAIAALGVATWRTLRERADPATVALLVLCLGSGALYWYDPEITPDHLWATRRYVPAILPSLTIWAAAAVAMLAALPAVGRLLARAPRALGTLALGLAALVLVVPAAQTTRPVRWQRIQPGYLQPILETCDALPDDAAVVVLGGFGGITLPQSLRSWCGVPAAGQGSALGPGELPTLQAQVEANGHRLFLLTPDVAGLAPYVRPGGPEVVSTSGMDQRWMAEQTLDRPPSRYLPPSEALTVPTPFALHLVEIDGG